VSVTKRMTDGLIKNWEMILYFAAFSFSCGLCYGMYSHPAWQEKQRVMQLCHPYVLYKSSLTGNWLCDSTEKWKD
jgi:hypothetical protein